MDDATQPQAGIDWMHAARGQDISTMSESELKAFLAMSHASYEAIKAAQATEPHYSSCKQGSRGYFWQAWPTRPTYQSACDAAVAEGYVPNWQEARNAAAAALGLPLCSDCTRHFGTDSHPPHDADTTFARETLRLRARRRRLARPPSKRRTAQSHRHIFYHLYTWGTSAPQRYEAHAVLQESPRFFWVNVHSVADEVQRPTDPERLRTWRVDRQALERGEEWRRWVLTPPELLQSPTSALAALGLTPPCTVRDVTRAYRQQARQLHPDVGGTNEAFTALHALYQAALGEVRGRDGRPRGR